MYFNLMAYSQWCIRQYKADHPLQCCGLDVSQRIGLYSLAYSYSERINRKSSEAILPYLSQALIFRPPYFFIAQFPHLQTGD